MVYFSTILYLQFLKLTSRKDRTRGFITLSFEDFFRFICEPVPEHTRVIDLGRKIIAFVPKHSSTPARPAQQIECREEQPSDSPGHFLLAVFGYIPELPESRKPQCIAKGHGVGPCPKAATFPHRLIAEAIYGVAMLVEGCYFSCIA